MKTKTFFFINLFLVAMSCFAQRVIGVRIGYVDMEYILENVEEYRDATEQLSAKAAKWKQEVELKLGKVEQMRKDLAAEKVLLTDELIAEREEEIQLLETETLNYQQDRFGPQGDLILQKRLLVQPIQDQVFVEVQKIGKNKRYDFIFDKSADVVMLYSEKKHDISDLVLREIGRTRRISKSKRAEKERNRLKEFQEAEAETDREISEALKERQEKAKAVKESRAKAVEDRRTEQLRLREERKKAYEERRKKLLEERETKRKAKPEEEQKDSTKAGKERNGLKEFQEAEAEADREISESPKERQEKAKADKESRAKAVEDRRTEQLRLRDERKKAYEERRKKLLEEREAKRKAKLEERNKEQQKDSTNQG